MKLSIPIIQAFLLISVMIVVSVLISQTLSTIFPRREMTESTKFRRKASRTLDKLVSSEHCLAVEDETKEKIIDLEALEHFQSRYPETEPYCARTYDYGYYVEVKSKDGEKEWYFGSKEHSEYDALKESVLLSIPVKIKNETEIKSGTITLRMYRGELEELVGLIDKPCETGSKVKKNITLSYPVELKYNYLCMKAESDFCRKSSCILNVEFEGVTSPGTYSFFSRREGEVVKVEVR